MLLKRYYGNILSFRPEVKVHFCTECALQVLSLRHWGGAGIYYGIFLTIMLQLPVSRDCGKSYKFHLQFSVTQFFVQHVSSETFYECKTLCHLIFLCITTGRELINGKIVGSQPALLRRVHCPPLMISTAVSADNLRVAGGRMRPRPDGWTDTALITTPIPAPSPPHSPGPGR